MIDPKYIRNELEMTAQRLAIRGYALNTTEIATLETERKSLQVATQSLQNDRNVYSKEIGQAKAKKLDVESLLLKVNEINERLKKTENELEVVQTRLNNILSSVPNLPHASVPEGKTEHDNIEIRRIGQPRDFDFEPRDHVDLGINKNLMDFETATKLAGSRFVILHNNLARLHRALIQFMIDTHIVEHGYKEVYVPYIVNKDSLYGTGQLPKFADDQFAIKGEEEFYLIPTAEVPVTNIFRNEIIESSRLPIKYVCHTPCFRSEAGSYGKDTRGMIRQHQFEKVELVQIVQPQNSYQAHEELTSHAEKILQKLNLPYRVVILCGGDLGFSAAKTYDLEVWLPGQNRYREISSCSNFEDFQARRLQARFRSPETKRPELVHTLNGSGLAVGRTLVAIMENYQDKEGTIHIPEILWPYMGGLKIIE